MTNARFGRRFDSSILVLVSIYLVSLNPRVDAGTTDASLARVRDVVVDVPSAISHAGSLLDTTWSATTVEAWIKTDAALKTDGRRINIINEWFMLLKEGHNSVCGGESHVLHITNTNLFGDQPGLCVTHDQGWVHIAATIDSATDTINYCLNGFCRGQHYTGPAVPSNQYTEGTRVLQPHGGLVSYAHVRVWKNVALTKHQLRCGALAETMDELADAVGGHNMASLRLWLPFAGDLTDLVSGVDATFAGVSPTFGTAEHVPPRCGDAVLPACEPSYVYTGSNAQIQPDGGLTYGMHPKGEFYVRMDFTTGSSVDDLQYLFSWGGAETATDQGTFIAFLITKNINVGVNSNALSSDPSATYELADILSPYTRYVFEFLYDRVERSIAAYIDGERVIAAVETPKNFNFVPGKLSIGTYDHNQLHYAFSGSYHEVAFHECTPRASLDGYVSSQSSLYLSDAQYSSWNAHDGNPNTMAQTTLGVDTYWFVDLGISGSHVRSVKLLGHITDARCNVLFLSGGCGTCGDCPGSYPNEGTVIGVASRRPTAGARWDGIVCAHITDSSQLPQTTTDSVRFDCPPETRGRYLYVQALSENGAANRNFAIGEIEIDQPSRPTSTNGLVVAQTPGGPARQPAKNAALGRPTTFVAAEDASDTVALAKTGEASNPWWYADLGREHRPSGVLVKFAGLPASQNPSASFADVIAPSEKLVVGISPSPCVDDEPCGGVTCAEFNTMGPWDAFDEETRTLGVSCPSHALGRYVYVQAIGTTARSLSIDHVMINAASTVSSCDVCFSSHGFSSMIVPMDSPVAFGPGETEPYAGLVPWTNSLMITSAGTDVDVLGAAPNPLPSWVENALGTRDLGNFDVRVYVASPTVVRAYRQSFWSNFDAFDAEGYARRGDLSWRSHFRSSENGDAASLMIVYERYLWPGSYSFSVDQVLYQFFKPAQHVTPGDRQPARLVSAIPPHVLEVLSWDKRSRRSGSG